MAVKVAAPSPYFDLFNNAVQKHGRLPMIPLLCSRRNLTVLRTLYGQCSHAMTGMK
jgi:hypothetical protein